MAFLDYPGLQRFKAWLDKTYMKITPDNFRQIKRDVDTGLAAKLYPVGTQILAKWAKSATAAEQEITWDVVHHYTNGDMALNWHYAFPDAIQFDAPEAIYYAPAGGLPAGQYYIPVASEYGAGWTVGLNINFTLTAAMDEGDQLFIDCGTNYANDPTAGRAWRVYAQGDTTVKQSGVTSNSDTGTALATIGAVNAHRTNGNVNAISRVVYGSGRWSESAIRQWLNSSATAGAWWIPKNGWDRPPAQATTLRGFLAGFTEDFLAVLEETEVVTALNTQEGFEETTETTMDKIFLPSLQEWYINPQLANVEGEDWDYYKELAAEAGLTGKFQQGQTYEILRKYNLEAKTSPVYVWLRSCNRGYAGVAWSVLSSGYVYGIANAYYAYRGCAACKIKKSA